MKTTTEKTGVIRFLKPHRGREVGSIDPSPPGVNPPSALPTGVQETLVMRGFAEWVTESPKPSSKSKKQQESLSKEDQ